MAVSRSTWLMEVTRWMAEKHRQFAGRRSSGNGRFRSRVHAHVWCGRRQVGSAVYRGHPGVVGGRWGPPRRPSGTRPRPRSLPTVPRSTPSSRRLLLDETCSPSAQTLHHNVVSTWSQSRGTGGQHCWFIGLNILRITNCLIQYETTSSVQFRTVPAMRTDLWRNETSTIERCWSINQ